MRVIIIVNFTHCRVHGRTFMTWWVHFLWRTTYTGPLRPMKVSRVSYHLVSRMMAPNGMVWFSHRQGLGLMINKGSHEWDMEWLWRIAPVLLLSEWQPCKTEWGSNQSGLHLVVPTSFRLIKRIWCRIANEVTTISSSKEVGGDFTYMHSNIEYASLYPTPSIFKAKPCPSLSCRGQEKAHWSDFDPSYVDGVVGLVLIWDCGRARAERRKRKEDRR